MANDELSKKLPVRTSRPAWPQTFEGKNQTYIGGIGSAQDRRPSPRERLVDSLFSIYSDDFQARKRVENIMTYVDASPAAVPLGAYDATRAIGEGRYTDAIIPGITAAAPFLGKPAKSVKDAIRRRHTAGEIIEDLTNSKPPEPTHNLGETPNGQISSAVGQVRTGDNGLPLVKVWDKLPPDQTNTVVAHELGHILDEYAGRVPTEGLDDELNMLYSELATGRSGPPFLLPEMRGYPDYAVPREKMAEAFRAYLTDANMIKTIAPKTAAALRKLNRLPFFSKYLQFNGIPIGLIAGSTALMGKASETQAHQPDADFNMATQDTKSGFRTIAAALKARGSNEPPNQKPISPGLGSIARAIFGRAGAYGDPR
jgi:hypothetical protein